MSTPRCSLRGPIVLSLILAAAAGSPALAQEGRGEGAASASAVGQAKALLRQGNEAFRAGEFAAAEQAYRKAYALRPGYDTAGSLGGALLRLERPAEAARYLDECVRTLPVSTPTALQERMTSALAHARARVGALRISVDVSGVDVIVDGMPVGRAPLEREIFVAPGTRLVEARRGEERASASVVIDAGSSQDVALTFGRGPSLPILVAGGAAGALGLASGVIFAVLSSGKGSDAEAAPQGSAARADLRDDQTILGNVSFWSFLGGAAVLAGTGIYALTAGSSEPAPAPAAGVRAAPLVTARGAGVVVVGAF